MIFSSVNCSTYPNFNFLLNSLFKLGGQTRLVLVTLTFED